MLPSGSGNAVANGTAGETITAGMPVYLDSTTTKYFKSDNNAAGKKTSAGIALNGASNGQPISVQTGGAITIGATVTVAASYYVSANAGMICPAGDLATGSDVILLGVAISTTVIQMPSGGPFVPGATVP